MIDALWHDILERRNQEVLASLDAALEDYARAIVPWGAAHMMEVEPAVLERDFEQVSQTERRVIAFAELFGAGEEVNDE